MKRSFVAFVVAAALAVAGNTLALPPGHGSGSMGGHGSGAPGYAPLSLLPLLIATADLTEEQKTDVSKIIEARGARFRTIFAELRRADEQLTNRVFEQGDLKASDLEPLTARVLELRGKLLRENMDMVVRIRDLLSPEQLEKAAAARRKMKDRSQNRMPPGHPPTGGGVEN